MLINFSMRPPQDGRPDERYAVKPPKGVCLNKYCPGEHKRHNKLVRGYCEPCASIRRPADQRDPYEFDPTRRTWSQGIDIY